MIGCLAVVLMMRLMGTANSAENDEPTGAAGHMAVEARADTLADPDAVLDALDEHTAFSAFNGLVRARLSGLLDLGGYLLTQPAPALIETQHTFLFNPRLSFSSI